MIKLPIDVTSKDYILHVIGENAIFERYLGIEPDNAKHTNPLRIDDKSASCYFYHNGVKWKFRDPAAKFDEDCFGIVVRKYNCSFWKACEIIANDFHLKEFDNIVRQEFDEAPIPQQIIAGSKLVIHTRSFTEYDVNYWKQYHVPTGLLRVYNVSSVHSYFMFSKRGNTYYRPKVDELCYDYRILEYHKIYKPYAPKEYKWYGNLPKRYYQGYSQLPERGDNLVITKSLKDVICLARFGLPAIAPTSEGSIISANAYDILSSRFNRIVTLYDYDYMGIVGAQKMKRLYNIKPLFFTNGKFNTIDYKAKDFSDFVKRNEIADVKRLIGNIINNM